jgi:hypothetical protein
MAIAGDDAAAESPVGAQGVMPAAWSASGPEEDVAEGEEVGAEAAAARRLLATCVRMHCSRPGEKSRCTVPEALTGYAKGGAPRAAGSRIRAGEGWLLGTEVAAPRGGRLEARGALLPPPPPPRPAR